MGGNHASQQSEEIMDSIDEIDFIITGECDFTFSEFVQKYLDGFFAKRNSWVRFFVGVDFW